MNIIFPEPKEDELLRKEHTRMGYKIEDILIPFQDDAYNRGLEVGKEKTIVAVLVALEELKKQFVAQDDNTAADQLAELITEINNA